MTIKCVITCYQVVDITFNDSTNFFTTDLYSSISNTGGVNESSRNFFKALFKSKFFYIDDELCVPKIHVSNRKIINNSVSD